MVKLGSRSRSLASATKAARFSEPGNVVPKRSKKDSSAPGQRRSRQRHQERGVLEERTECSFEPAAVSHGNTGFVRINTMLAGEKNDHAWHTTRQPMKNSRIGCNLRIKPFTPPLPRRPLPPIPWSPEFGNRPNLQTAPDNVGGDRSNLVDEDRWQSSHLGYLQPHATRTLFTNDMRRMVLMLMMAMTLAPSSCVRSLGAVE